MFKKIILATDGSPACDNAAKVAFDLAERQQAELVVFHVLGLPTRGFSTMVKDVRTGETETIGGDYKEWVIDELKNTYAEQIKTYPARIDTCEGVPGREILRAARNEDADLIIMGANTRSEGTGAARHREVVGDTMRKVAKSARCPVLIVNRPCTTCWNLFSNVVFATDFSKAADSAFKFAEAAAKSAGAKLYLFNVVDLSTSDMGLFPGQKRIEDVIAENQQKLSSKYIAGMGGYDNYEMDVREGTPYVEILKFAREKQADLIVMAHHTKDVAPELTEIGSTVQEVVLRSACPVASVTHPDKVVSIDDVEGEPAMASA